MTTHCKFPLSKALSIQSPPYSFTADGLDFQREAGKESTKENIRCYVTKAAFQSAVTDQVMYRTVRLKILNTVLDPNKLKVV